MIFCVLYSVTDCANDDIIQNVQNLQLRKIVEMVINLDRNDEQIFDWTVVVITHGTGTQFTGPFTLWDGNHRAVALYGYYDLLLDRIASADTETQTAKARDAMERLMSNSVRLFVGQSTTIHSGHKGSFYCISEEKPIFD